MLFGWGGRRLLSLLGDTTDITYHLRKLYRCAMGMLYGQSSHCQRLNDTVVVLGAEYHQTTSRQPNLGRTWEGNNRLFAQTSGDRSLLMLRKVCGAFHTRPCSPSFVQEYHRLPAKPSIMDLRYESRLYHLMSSLWNLNQNFHDDLFVTCAAPYQHSYPCPEKAKCYTCDTDTARKAHLPISNRTGHHYKTPLPQVPLGFENRQIPPEEGSQRFLPIRWR